MPTPEFLNSDVLKGSGHLAQAYADLVLRSDFSSAYEEFTSALALFRTTDIIPKVMADVDAKAKVLSANKDAKPQ